MPKQSRRCTTSTKENKPDFACAVGHPAREVQFPSPQRSPNAAAIQLNHG
jgi:hypothetical protein